MFVSPRGEQPTLASQWDGVFTAAQAERGRGAYQQTCAECHGVDLAGLPQIIQYPGQSPRTPALAGDVFAANWNGMSLAQIFERIRTSMPQQSPGVLRRQTVADILAYMFAQSGYPSGAAELPPTPDFLGDIKFLRAKP